MLGEGAGGKGYRESLRIELGIGFGGRGGWCVVVVVVAEDVAVVTAMSLH